MISFYSTLLYFLKHGKHADAVLQLNHATDHADRSHAD